MLPPAPAPAIASTEDWPGWGWDSPVQLALALWQPAAVAEKETVEELSDPGVVVASTFALALPAPCDETESDTCHPSNQLNPVGSKRSKLALPCAHCGDVIASVRRLQRPRA